MTNTNSNPMQDAPEQTRVTTQTVAIIPAVLTPPLNWRSLFGNDFPVELEIGSGRGMFLKESAKLFPKTNYIGVELAGKFYRIALERLARAGLPNIRLMHANGLDLLERWVPENSLQALHIYFPDPWPKKRHHKRRLFTPYLMEQAARKIITGGEFRVATDHQQLGDLIRKQFAAHVHLFEENPWPEGALARLPTNYSLKWKRAGRNLWWARFTNISAG